MPFILLPVAPFLLTSFGDERSKAPRRLPLKNIVRNFKKIFRFLLGVQKEEGTGLPPASSPITLSNQPQHPTGGPP